MRTATSTHPGWTNGSGPTCSDPNVDPGANIAVYPNCPSNVFQYHHQPFNYFASFDPNTAQGLANRKAHLKDEQEFIQQAHASGGTCRLKPVSFVKPFGLENEHPGYSSETRQRQPSRFVAEDDRLERVREGHDGRRHV